MPSSDLLRTFVVIAECGNLTHAANRLHKTQSAVSVQLRKLEDALKVQLFDRHTRGMTLSVNGEKLLPAASRALAELQRTADLFGEPLTGSLRVGIPDDFDDLVLERALVEFSQRNPGIEVVARSGCTSAYAEAIDKGALDIAVCSDTDDVPGELLASEPTVWASSAALQLDRDAPIPLAVLDRNCRWRDMPSRALERCGRTWKVAYKSESFPSLRAAIRSGFAVGVLPMRSVDPDMRILAAKEGLPPLPPSKRSILINADAPVELTAAMSDAIRNAVFERPV